ncbi:pCP2475L [African swine fever virus]|uniref:BA71V-CP2475L (P220) n=1 Tax=African swine fever virus TaxID=10497 RepID=A0A0C5B049_ASF|nr:BA71V-CP2475L (p220) [African swine fever virus]UYB79246.1 p220 [Recombinant African swine fever virus]AJL34270.1 BA71V-CP2475L (p220) [African swine fever virus]AXB49320.1 pCP2475L [African swine fever virus]AXB49494.1 pCP2475L [African swine fever virus]AXB49666.1 pCP2475L [African swine fever virus]
MGNRGSSTSSRPPLSSEANLYAKLQDHIQRQTRSFSGGGYFNGGGDKNPVQHIKDYHIDSVSSKAKLRIIEGIIKAISKIGFKVDTKQPIEDILKDIKKQLPDPRAGSTFVKNAEKQETICKMIADAINQEFIDLGQDKLIDTTEGAASICRQIVLYINSLTHGLRAEYLDVHGSIENTLENIKLLSDAIKQLHERMVTEVTKAAPNEEVINAVTMIEAVYRRLLNEQNLQINILTNFIDNILTPTQKELDKLKTDEVDIIKILNDTNSVLGTKNFGKVLSYTLCNLGIAATVANKINKALQRVGLKVEQYLHSKNWAEFDKELDLKRFSGLVSAENIAEFEKAVNLLRQTFNERHKILENNCAKKGGDEEKTPLDKRMEAQRLDRKHILMEFLNKSTQAYNDFLENVKKIGMKLVKEIALTPNITKLRDALSRINDMGTIALDLSLIGFYNNAAAREERETFLIQLTLVKNVLEELAKTDPNFKNLYDSCFRLLQIIDFYTDIVQKKYGGGEDCECTKVGGAALTVEELGLSKAARSQVDLNQAINTFMYYYYVAQIYSNLTHNKQEFQSYEENYATILGDAIAGRLMQLDTEKNARINSPAVDLARGHVGPNPGGAQEVDWKATISAIELEYDVKRRFYRALEGLDLYLKNITKTFVNNIDSIQTVQQMLDGVRIIGRWFTEATGDTLAQVFESFPTSAGNDSNVFTDNAPAGHYYEKVAAEIQQGRGVGTLRPVRASQAKNIRDLIGRSLSNFQALKNIINAFARIGDMLGGEELRQTVPMSPLQIYKTLLEYIQHSALSVGLKNLNQTQIGGQRVALAQTAEEASQRVYLSTVRVNDALSTRWETEDVFFTFMLKSMAAKIFIVLGIYDMFERPEPVYKLIPTRMILGGADELEPEVIPEAAGLYFRLPRLAEFYQKLFSFRDENVQISMLPELEGIFSGLIRVIFMRPIELINIGDYSETEIRQLIKEINVIYQHFNLEYGEQEAVKKALIHFVNEINRRFGVITRTEWEKFQRIVQEARTMNDFGMMNQTNYSILPDEDGYTQSSQLLPSDRFIGPSSQPTPKWRPALYNIDSVDVQTGMLQPNSQWDLVQKFRKQLSEMFEDPSLQQELGKVSYQELIQQATNELKKEHTDKIQIVSKLIQGSESLADTDVNKIFLFHETVITGLNLLSAIYVLLNTFRNNIKALDLDMIQKSIVEWLRETQAANVNHANLIDWLGRRHGDISEIRNPGLVIKANDARLSMVYPDPTTDPTLPQDQNLTTETLFAWIEQYVGIPAGGGIRPEQELAARYLVDNQRIMQLLLTNIFEMTSSFNKLVQVRFPETSTAHVHLDFTGLISLIDSLMADTKYFLDLLRPHIDKNIIQYYENRSNPGSFYWLEEHLIDKLIKPPTDAGGRPLPGGELGLEGVNQIINKTYILLTKPYNVLHLRGGAQRRDAANIQINNNPELSERYEQYGRVFSRLVFYDALDNNSGLRVEQVALGDFRLSNLIRTNNAQEENALSFWTAVAPAPRAYANVNNAANNLRRYRLYGSDYGIRNNRSMMMVFNQLVASYIARFYDAPSGKIYLNLINAFANGNFSQAVMELGYAHPDLARDNIAFGHRGDPTEQSVLLLSLGLMLQRLIKDTNRQGLSQHLISTLTEIPIYLKENYRANLPLYNKMFNILISQGELLKQFIQYTKVQLARPNLMALLGANNDAIIYYNNINVPNTGLSIGQAALRGIGSVFRPDITLMPLGDAQNNTNDIVRKRLIAVINGVIRGSLTLANSAMEVLHELTDHPIYLETEEHFIQNYMSRYNKEPLMPFSLSLYYLRDLRMENNEVYDPLLYPNLESGSPEFKILYGTRKLLGNDPVQLSDMPGVQLIMKNYNETVVAREQITPTRFEHFYIHAIQALRFIINIRSFKTVMTYNENTFGGVNLISENRDDKPIITAGIGMNAVYSLRKTLQDVISFVESSYQEEQINNIHKIVSPKSQTRSLGSNRERERIFNLFDMNIMPINVNALMRSIPLANIYNYDYSFEEIACLMYGISAEKVRSLDTGAPQPDVAVVLNIPNRPPMNTREFMLKLLINPYVTVSISQYGNELLSRGNAGYMSRIFRGDNALNMGRPKFLSDQIFNKVLFGSLYPTQFDYDEAGPGLAAGIQRGRERWGHPMSIYINQALHEVVRTIRLAETVRGLRNVIDRNQIIDELNAFRTQLEDTRREVDNLLQTPEIQNNVIPEIIAAVQNWGQQYRGQITDLIDLIGNAGQGGNSMIPLIQIITAQTAAAQLTALFNRRGIPAPVPRQQLQNDIEALQWFMTMVINHPPILIAPFMILVNNLKDFLDTLEQYVYRNPRWLGPRTARIAHPPVGMAPGNIRYPTSYTENSVLTYIAEQNQEEGPWSIVKQVGVGIQKPALIQIGKDRFDTRLIRNLIFITNIQRLLRLRLNLELSQFRNVLVSPDHIINPSITEYGFSITGPSETFSDKQYDSDIRIL